MKEYSYYHANATRTGAMLRLKLEPTVYDVGTRIEGRLVLDLMLQTQGEIPSFDHANPLTVQLGVEDVVQFIQVLRGHYLSIQDGKGLFHVSPSTNSVIRFCHLCEPCPGFELEIWQKDRSTSEERRGRFSFNSGKGEDILLLSLLENALPVIAWGE